VVNRPNRRRGARAAGNEAASTGSERAKALKSAQPTAPPRNGTGSPSVSARSPSAHRARAASGSPGTGSATPARTMAASVPTSKVSMASTPMKENRAWDSPPVTDSSR